jgi:hypothetical protein
MGVWDFFKSIWSSWIGQLFRKAATTAAGELAEGIADIAQAVVIGLANNSKLTNAQRWQFAKRIITQTCIDEGREFTGHAVNIAIELASAIVAQGAKKLIDSAEQNAK